MQAPAGPSWKPTAQSACCTSGTPCGMTGDIAALAGAMFKNMATVAAAAQEVQTLDMNFTLS